MKRVERNSIKMEGAKNTGNLCMNALGLKKLEIVNNKVMRNS